MEQKLEKCLTVNCGIFCIVTAVEKQLSTEPQEELSSLELFALVLRLLSEVQLKAVPWLGVTANTASKKYQGQ